MTCQCCGWAREYGPFCGACAPESIRRRPPTEPPSIIPPGYLDEMRREIRARSLDDAADAFDTAPDPGRGTAAWDASVLPMRDEFTAWLRARAARERAPR